MFIFLTISLELQDLGISVVQKNSRTAKNDIQGDSLRMISAEAACLTRKKIINSTRY